MKQLLKIVRNWTRNQERVPVIPNTTHKKVIGKSHNERSIDMYSVGSGPIHVVFGFGIHGNEVGTVKLGHHLINELVSRGQNFFNLTIHVIPVINPDGFALAKQQPDYSHGGRIGRFNAHRVDLNRNFPSASFQTHSVWNRGKAYSETTEVYCGETGGSEPETQALMELCTAMKPALLVMIHSVGPDILANSIAPANQYAALFSQHTGFPTYTENNWKKLGQTGTAKEWTEYAGIPFVEIETPSRYKSHWAQLQPAIVACLERVNAVVGA